MTTPTQRVQAFYERLAHSDPEGAMALLSDDVELLQAESLPYGGRHVGQVGIQNFFSQFFACWEAFRSEDMTYFANGNQIVVTSMAHGITRQHEVVVMPMVQVYILRDERICQVRPFYFDTARLSF